MGGHGGLNILPQKKWNVYNHDNRAIVDHDKQQVQKTKRDKYEKDRSDKLTNKIQVLKQQKIHQYNNQSKLIRNDYEFINCVNQSFIKNKQLKHINLFQKQQQIISNKQISDFKTIKQTQYLKDKNFDYTSKFLGNYNDKNKQQPWYIRQKGYIQSKKKHLQLQQLLSVKKSDSNTLDEVIKIQKNHLQRSRQKKKQLSSSSTNLNSIEILRQKRLKRQLKEKIKTFKLINHN